MQRACRGGRGDGCARLVGSDHGADSAERRWVRLVDRGSARREAAGGEGRGARERSRDRGVFWSEATSVRAHPGSGVTGEAGRVARRGGEVAAGRSRGRARAGEASARRGGGRTWASPYASQGAHHGPRSSATTGSDAHRTGDGSQEDREPTSTPGAWATRPCVQDKHSTPRRSPGRNGPGVFVEPVGRREGAPGACDVGAEGGRPEGDRRAPGGPQRKTT